MNKGDISQVDDDGGKMGTTCGKVLQPIDPRTLVVEDNIIPNDIKWLCRSLRRPIRLFCSVSSVLARDDGGLTGRAVKHSFTS